jgi:hypothetical protein
VAQIDVYKEWLGIPEGDRPPDHYALLRLVPFEDDTERIRANYKKLNTHVRKYATGTYAAQSQELLNELAKAMLCLTDPQRKREYDEEQGREFAETEDPLGRKPTARVLVDRKQITREQAREAEEFAEARGLTVRDAVVQMQLVEHDAAASAYSVELGLPYVDLEDMPPEDAVLDAVPKHVVKRNSILPLFEDDGMLLVACSEMPSHELEEELRLRFEVPMRPVIATPRAIQQAIAKYYAPGARDEAAGEAGPRASKGKAAKTAKSDGQQTKPGKPAKAAPVPRSGPMNEEEKAERTKLGIIFICWAIILPVVVENYVLKTVIAGWPLFLGFLGPLTLVLTPAVIAWVVLVYWRKK